MKIQIKFRWSDKILFEGEYNSMKQCLTDAVLTDAVLTGAVLTGADLKDAVLTGADLTGADLTDADLTDAVLTDAVLTGAVLTGADLTDADLTDAVLTGAVLTGADLTGADLTGADLTDAVLRDAVLRGADLKGADLTGADLTGAVLTDAVLRGVPEIKNIHQEIYNAASHPGALDMSDWHICDTTHCRAGWVITLAGDAGKAMEFCMGTSVAAALIYLKSDPKLEKVPNFYADNETAMADMKRLAELEKGEPI